LWLVEQNKILTKDNLLKRKWQKDSKCIFWDNLESVNHLFLHCSVAHCLWSWIYNYNNCSFTCLVISDLWYVDVNFPYKDENMCELIRGAFLWSIWKEKNRIIFKGGRCKTLRSLGNDIITSARY
jgi:zinc-binding in reverse transcriptase